MKKSLTALAVLAFVGTAAAQSSVTLFGVADVGVAHLSGSTLSKTGVSTGGANISRWGFRGTEDLGGGLKAGFWLEAGMNMDDGTGKGTGGGMAFNRRATVSLMGDWGELRVGRDDTPTFLSTLIFDPFLTNGVGGTMGFVMLGAPIQISNSVGYFLPGNLGGFYGQVQHARGEQLNATGTGASPQGNYTGARAGYRSGPLNVALATGELRGATSADDLKANNIAASYDFGMVKPMLLWATEKKGPAKITAIQLGATAPLGQGELRASFGHYDTSGSNADWRKLSLGYGHNLSRRTQVYGSYSRVNNSAASQRAIGVQGVAAPGNVLGGHSNGYEVGVRHFF